MISELNDVVLHEKKKELRFLTTERIYHYDHPDVIHYTEYFSNRAQEQQVFANIDSVLTHNRHLVSAEKIGGVWSEFSKFVPSFISKAVLMANDPEHQHYLIQIAYDELGAKDKNHIHSKLFLEALGHANINLSKTIPLLPIRKMLSSLHDILENTTSISGIIGLLLSFEIIAERNIETLFRGLAIDSSREESLAASLFFKIHRMDEIEHIRHSVANFLRFSQSQEAMIEAEAFFDLGIVFWKNFWDKIAELII